MTADYIVRVDLVTRVLDFFQFGGPSETRRRDQA